MSKSSNPIGIFDSGIGGLTVANSIYNHLPTENLIYFGDTLHLPYGEKSPEAILGYSEKIADFLLSLNCKVIVIACNSASAHAYESLKEKLKNQVFLVNVIDPVVEFICEQKNTKTIGIIGTRATINSNIYTNKITAHNKNLTTKSKATPLLAAYIEEGFYKKPEITKLVLKEYLSDKKFENIDSLILACTHYPLIKKEIDNFYKKKVKLIDSTKIVAKKVKQILENNNLTNDLYSENHQFFVSDYTKSFESTAKQFFKQPLRLVEKKL